MITVKGVCLGAKTEVINGQNGSYEKHFIGIQMPKPGGFEGEVIVEKVQMTRDQQSSGLAQTYNDLRGKSVEADVFINTFVTRNGAGYQLMLSGNGHPRPLAK